MKQLKHAIKLSCNVRIYVPSTASTDQAIDSTTIDQRVDRSLSFLSSLFNGATSFKAYGAWLSGKELIKESITIVESHCTSEALETNIGNVYDHALQLKADYSQESIGIEINNIFYLI